MGSVGAWSNPGAGDSPKWVAKPRHGQGYARTDIVAQKRGRFCCLPYASPGACSRCRARHAPGPDLIELVTALHDGGASIPRWEAWVRPQATERSDHALTLWKAGERIRQF